MIDRLLAEQVERLERSAFYRDRLAGAEVRTVSDLRAVPFLTKDELRADQRAHPPFGDHLCAARDELVRLHVTSGTTGEPVAIGLTPRDHEANSLVGGQAFRLAGVRPDDTIAHCLNYALYAGGIADHMALEASGATVVPVGVGQSERLLRLIPQLGITALFGTLSYPAYLAAQTERPPPLRHIVTAGEPGAGLAAVRREIEAAWGATVADTFGMSDVWSTMGAECGEGDGLHLTCLEHAVLELVDPDTAAPVELADGAFGELVWTHLQREASPLLRYRSGDLARVWTSPCACGLATPRIRIEGRRDDMLRVQAVNVYPAAIGELVGHIGRWRVLASGDPIVPPLRVEVEAPPEADLGALAGDLRSRLGATFEVVRLNPGTLPISELKTPLVERRP
ncbi:MAG: phenylacetate-CoA ligase [Solirubrobacteraceae bacterium]|nr:phenylacetate-CoA ligase [Solirubrobacteraceae bacterium]